MCNEHQINNYLELIYRNSKLINWNLPIIDIIKMIDINDYPIDGIYLFKTLLKTYCIKYKPNAKIIIYKGTPIMPWLINELYKYFKDVKIIHLFRDPRAVYNSQKKTKNPYTLEPLSISPIFTAIEWKKSINIINFKNNNIFNIKYENLILNNKRIIKDLLMFLNINNKKVEENNYSDLIPNIESKIHINIDKNINIKNIDKWKNNLLDKEILYIESIAKSEMKMNGYKLINYNNNIFNRIIFLLELLKINFISVNMRLCRIIYGIVFNPKLYIIKIKSKLKYYNYIN